MRVLLNGLTALKPRTGIGHYSARLAAEMATLLDDDFAVYPPAPWNSLASRFMHGSSKPGSGGQSSVRSLFMGAAKRWGRTAAGLHFDRYCRTYGVQVYHEPNYIPFPTSVPTVVTVHDLSVLLHPEWHPADRVREHGQRLRRATAAAAHVITDTEQVRREVMDALSLPAERVTAIYLGVGTEYRPVSEEECSIWRRRFNLPKQYFLCVGTIEPRKNLLTAMRAFAALPDDVRRQSPLVLAGPWGWRAQLEFDYFERSGKDLGIRHLGYVNDEALPALYSGATALLYPSLYEGFGLPPLEAIACGTQAICSRGTLAVREVMGSSAIWCDATDIDAWRGAMLAGLDASPARQNHCFDWRRTAELTLSVYDRVQGKVTQSHRRAA